MSFIVENNMNTSYMDTLFVSLFYINTFTENLLLKCNPIKPEYIYLQELIKCNFIDNIRNKKSILLDNNNEILIYCHLCGWLKSSELNDKQDVALYFHFLTNAFDYCMITTDLNDNNKIPYITFNLSNNIQYSIKELYYDWIHQNGVINNLPTILSFKINHLNSSAKLNIQKKLKLNPLKEYDPLVWSFHSAICLHHNTSHYYTILNDCSKWFMYDNLEVPCMTRIDMSDSSIINTIMFEVVFVIYLYNNTEY